MSIIKHYDIDHTAYNISISMVKYEYIYSIQLQLASIGNVYFDVNVTKMEASLVLPHPHVAV